MPYPKYMSEEELTKKSRERAARMKVEDFYAKKQAEARERLKKKKPRPKTAQERAVERSAGRLKGTGFGALAEALKSEK